jgi:hypothetical protein
VAVIAAGVAFGPGSSALLNQIERACRKRKQCKRLPLHANLNDKNLYRCLGRLDEAIADISQTGS